VNVVTQECGEEIAGYGRNLISQVMDVIDCQRQQHCFLHVIAIGVGDGGQRGHVPPPQKKKSGKIFFGQ